MALRVAERGDFETWMATKLGSTENGSKYPAVAICARPVFAHQGELYDILDGPTNRLHTFLRNMKTDSQINEAIQQNAITPFVGEPTVRAGGAALRSERPPRDGHPLRFTEIELTETGEITILSNQIAKNDPNADDLNRPDTVFTDRICELAKQTIIAARLVADEMMSQSDWHVGILAINLQNTKAFESNVWWGDQQRFSDPTEDQDAVL